MRLLLLTMLLAAGLTALIGLNGTVATVLMSLCVGAAVAFLTPVATPANMMVMGPAGYRFGDYWRLGLPLVALFGVIGIFWVPVVWHY